VRERRRQQHIGAAAALTSSGGFGLQLGNRQIGAMAASERSLSELHMHSQFAGLLEEVVHGKALRTRLHSAHARAHDLASSESAAGTHLALSLPLSANAAQRLSAVLSQQQAAIAQLVTVLNTNARDLAIMQAALPQRTISAGTAEMRY